MKTTVSNARQEYVFLDICHSIGRCILTTAVSGVQVF